MVWSPARLENVLKRDFRVPEPQPMNSIVPVRRTLISVAAVAAVMLASIPATVVHAAPVVWTGFATSALWSDALNWSPQGTPADGDDLVFGSAPARTSTIFDIVRTFSSLSFSADAPLFTTHVLGSGAQLAFSGVGIRSLDTLGTATGRQTFFADAGSTGGTILFTNGSGINVGSAQFARPVDITAQGGSVAGAVGGHIVFQDTSTTSDTTFDVVRAAGATVAGASGGDIIVRDNALLTRLASLVVAGGSSGGAAGGRASFLGQSQLAGGASIQAGQSGGLGGRVDISGNAVALGTSSIYAEGGQSALAGSEAVARLRDDARMIGAAYLGAGGVAGANGGKIEFFDRSSHDTSSFPATAGSLGIYNVGAVAPGAGGGALVFHDDSAIRGSHLVIANQTAEFVAPGASAGSTSFLDRTRAGQVEIDNAGAGGAGAAGGATYFRHQSSAANATITSLGGLAFGAAGGSTAFSDSAGAGAASLHNAGGSAAGALGGTLDFKNASRAGTATIVNTPGEVPGATGGVTTFWDNTGAGGAFISNDTSFSVAGGGAGRSYFRNSASAQQASIDNQGGLAFPAALTAFYDDASAGSARITNFGGKAAGVYGGFTQFFDRASAGTASIVTAGGGFNGSFGGVVQFFGDSTAAGARIDLRSALVAGAGGASAFFSQNASAGSASFTVQGAQVNTVRGPEAASVTFEGDASAANASFIIGGNLLAFGSPARVLFNDGSTAADASFTTLAGFDAGGKLSFEGSTAQLSIAGHARITNGSRATASASTGDFGGATLFLAHSSADHATITNQAGRTAFGAQTVFRADSTAADATIVNAGGSAGESGGITFFQDTSSAGRAVITNRAGAMRANGLALFSNTASAAQSAITANGASVNGDVGGRVTFTDNARAAQSTLIAEGGSGGGAGGRIEFKLQATGGPARVVLNAGSTADTGGLLDISGVDVWLAVGSIEGGGTVNLGARSLIVGGNGRSTTFSGVIRGDTPPVFPSLTVQAESLTLTGANLYAGRTSIGDGLNANSGKLVVANTTGSATGSGAVVIERGGTLAGSGFVAGPVTLLDGGTIAPGDPVTLTLQDRLVWNGGGVIRLVIGADDAGSDHLVVHSLVRGSTGSFTFQLIDAGFTAGASYALLQFDQIEGFAAADFSFAGLAGSFSLANGTLGFTPTAVPEPGSATLFVAGLLGIWQLRRRWARAAH